MKKIMLTLFLCLFCVGSLMAQSESDTLFQTVAECLHAFQRLAPREKVYVHQDRTQYVAGETIWFKVYQWVSPSFPVPSGVVYVEIIDGYNRKVADTRWPLPGGSAAGHIELSDTLAEGTYQLRAYTLWQTKSAVDDIFTREFQIASAKRDLWGIETDFSVAGHIISAVLRFPGEMEEEGLSYRLKINGETSKSYPILPDENREFLMDIELPDSLILEGPQFFIMETPDASREYPIPLSPAIRFELFPEGGYLVAGIPSKVAFKATDQYGKGLDVKGIVTDDKGNEVRRFESSHQGLGSFSILPEEGRRYTAILDDSRVKQKIPESQPEGIVMNVAHRSDRLRVTMRHNLTVNQPDGSPLYMMVHQEGVTFYNVRMDMEKAMSVIDIPHENLPEGIFTLTVYDADYKAYVERLCLVKYPERMDLRIIVSEEPVKRRQKVTLELKEDSELGSLSNGDFSIAVVRADLYDPEKNENLYTHLFLSGELKGKIENPETFFNPDKDSSFRNLDLLLLTQCWRRYDWDTIMAGDYPEWNDEIETGLTLSGKVYPENERQKTEEIQVTAVIRHDEFNEILSFTPDQEGRFSFVDCEFTDTAEVVLSATYKKRALDVSITEQHREQPDYYDYGYGLAKAREEEQPGIAKGVTGEGIDQIVHELAEVSVTARRRRARGSQIYHQSMHDEVFNMRTYNVMKNTSYTMASDDGTGYLGAIGLLHFLPGVTIHNGKVRVRGTGAMEQNIYGQVNAAYADPVYVLDGVRTTYQNLTTISPSMIEKIEVLNPTSAMFYDQAPWGGALVFHTRNWDGMVYSTPTKTITHKFPGYNQTREFYSPDYGAVREYIDPDHRNTLHWQPSITLNEEGKAVVSFYTSDDAGDYLIHCEGCSEDGRIGVMFCRISTN